MTTTPVVAVSGLRKEYGSLVAVDDISFEIRAEEIFALVGPNGAGKTTTVEILECLRTPTSGSATVLGHDVTDETRAIKDRIGVVPQSFHTFERLTVRENVALVRQLYGEGLAVAEVLDQLNLATYADTPFAQLSGGYQRRTGIAMALVGDPEILFLDEPTTGLDPAARRTTWAQIERLADLGTTVVLTTHYMEEVDELADRAALLVDGTIEAVDTVEGLVAEYGGGLKLSVEIGDDADDVQSVLEAAATEVYRDDEGNLVGLFEDATRARETFGELQALEAERTLNLTTGGMEDVFLRLAGESGGERA